MALDAAKLHPDFRASILLDNIGDLFSNEGDCMRLSVDQVGGEGVVSAAHCADHWEIPGMKRMDRASAAHEIGNI